MFCIVLGVSAQNYDIRFNRTSINCSTRQVCYDVQLRPNGSTNFNLAGQNYRIYYNSSVASYQSGTSVLPSQYGAYTVVQDIQGANADAVNGALPFEATLGFLNYFMDLNDTQNGGIYLPAGQWTTTSNLCFTVTQETIDNPNVCVEAVWAREGLTDPYATAFVEVSRWVSTNNTTNSVGVIYEDLSSSSGDQACFNIACAVSSITVSDITVNEDAGVAGVQVCIGAAAAQNVTVSLATSNGTALSGSDYTTTNTVVTIPAGQTCTVVNIPIVNDNVYEGTETFNVTLTSPSSNATIADPTGTVTILDNETIPTLSINDITVNENVGTTNLTITLSGPSQTATTVVVNTSNGTAISGSDYQSITSFTVTIPAGQTSVSLPIPILDDAIFEPTESFNVVMSSPSSNATIADPTGTVTILDNEPVPTLSINDITVNENAGTADLTISLSGPSQTATTVVVNTSNGTAVSGSDYQSITSFTVTIPAGQTSVTLPISILDDTISEPTESFNVVMSSPSSNATIADPTGTVTILDNEVACNAQAPVISGN